MWMVQFRVPTIGLLLFFKNIFGVDLIINQHTLNKYEACMHAFKLVEFENTWEFE